MSLEYDIEPVPAGPTFSPVTGFGLHLRNNFSDDLGDDLPRYGSVTETGRFPESD